MNGNITQNLKISNRIIIFFQNLSQCHGNNVFSRYFNSKFRKYYVLHLLLNPNAYFFKSQINDEEILHEEHQLDLWAQEKVQNSKQAITPIVKNTKPEKIQINGSQFSTKTKKIRQKMNKMMKRNYKKQRHPITSKKRRKESSSKIPEMNYMNIWKQMNLHFTFEREKLNTLTEKSITLEEKVNQLIDLEKRKRVNANSEEEKEKKEIQPKVEELNELLKKYEGKFNFHIGEQKEFVGYLQREIELLKGTTNFIRNLTSKCNNNELLNEINPHSPSRTNTEDDFLFKSFKNFNFKNKPINLDKFLIQNDGDNEIDADNCNERENIDANEQNHVVGSKLELDDLAKNESQESKAPTSGRRENSYKVHSYSDTDSGSKLNSLEDNITHKRICAKSYNDLKTKSSGMNIFENNLSSDQAHNIIEKKEKSSRNKQMQKKDLSISIEEEPEEEMGVLVNESDMDQNKAISCTNIDIELDSGTHCNKKEGINKYYDNGTPPRSGVNRSEDEGENDPLEELLELDQKKQYKFFLSTPKKTIKEEDMILKLLEEEQLNNKRKSSVCSVDSEELENEMKEELQIINQNKGRRIFAPLHNQHDNILNSLASPNNNDNDKDNQNENENYFVKKTHITPVKRLNPFSNKGNGGRKKDCPDIDDLIGVITPPVQKKKEFNRFINNTQIDALLLEEENNMSGEKHLSPSSQLQNQFEKCGEPNEPILSDFSPPRSRVNYGNGINSNRRGLATKITHSVEKQIHLLLTSNLE